MRAFKLGAALLCAIAVSSGCGGGHEATSHETAAATPAPPPPTPDTTPVEALRTPAGLVLKPAEAVPTQPPAPAPTQAPK
jgi:hypothetical protein